LGFLRRLVHGTNPRLWLQEIRRRMDEKSHSAETGVVTES
jgi:hypothetical protein